MKKCVLYCTTCVLLGVLFLRFGHSDTHDMSITHTEINTLLPNQTNTKPSVLAMEDVLKVLDTLDQAGDVHIDYVHTIDIDSITYEMDWVGSVYNYDVDRCHTSAVTDKFYADMWYSEDDYILNVDKQEYVDTAYSYLKDSYQTSLRTIRLICQMTATGEVQEVYETDGYIVYKAFSDKQIAESNVLHVTTDSNVRSTSWVVRVPNDANNEYTAVLTIYPDENSAGITCETYSYKFNIDTGFSCTFPVDYESTCDY